MTGIPIALYICVLQSQDRCPHIPAYAKSAILGTPYVLCMQDVARVDLVLDVTITPIDLRTVYRIVEFEQLGGSCGSLSLMIQIQ